MDGWTELLRGQRADLCLVVDYATTGRPEAKFTDMCAQFHSDPKRPLPSVMQCVPPQPAEPLPPGGYVKLLLSPLAAQHLPVSSVLGFCLGAPLAAAIADELGRRQTHRPLTVLIDPRKPEWPDVLAEHDAALSGLSAGPPGADLIAAKRRAQALVRTGTPSVSIATTLAGDFAECAAVRFAEMGVEEDVAAELGHTYRAYLNYLAAAVGTDLDPAPDTTVVMYSRDVPSAFPDNDAPEQIRFDVSHAEMLGDAGPARTVERILLERAGR